MDVSMGRLDGVSDSTKAQGRRSEGGMPKLGRGSIAAGPVDQADYVT
jgi:hypothetical protein